MITVHELDPAEPADLDTAVAVRVELSKESHPAGPHATRNSVRRQLIGSDLMARCTLAAAAGEEPLGLLRMMFWNIEGSRDIAVCNLEVRPTHRRKRIGATLLQHGIDRCIELGKTNVIGTGVESAQTDAFWGSWLGLNKGLVERESRLQLAAVDGALMAQWSEQRHQRAATYRLHHVRGPFPADLRPAVATLNTAMNDAPLDDLEVDPEIWTVADVTADDELRRLRGEERWTTIAFAPDGAPAGLTAVILNDDDTELGVQSNTVVLDAHRHRGIGRWLKADMWQRLRRDRPGLASLLVENAASNDAMLAINDAMGFRETARYADWQGEASVIRDRLAR